MITLAGYEMHETYHSTLRSYRYDRIMETMGFGNEIATFCIVRQDGRTEQHILTDTGVLIIRNPIENKLITFWIANLSQAERCFTESNQKMPNWYRKAIIRNQKWSIC